MKKVELILASSSPRRKELMETIGIPFKIEVSDINESMNMENNLVEEIKELAYRKAKVIADQHPDAVVLGADTIVVYKDEVLGKPIDEEDAFCMLKKYQIKLMKYLLEYVYLIKV